MRRADFRIGAFACATLIIAAPAFAQSASPQTAASPWSLHDALGAPDALKLTAAVRVRFDTIDGQPRPGFNSSDDVVNLRTTLFAEYDAGPLRIGAELYDSRVYSANARTPITTNEVNVAEFVQAYAALDVEAPFGAGSTATLQAGRFVLNLGSRRLVAADDYRNTTNGYTGLRADIRAASGLSATGIYVLPTFRLPDDLPSLLDNRREFDRESFDTVLWGAVVNRGRIVGPVAGELSFFHLGERDGPNRPTRDRSLNTVGGRVYREPTAGKIDFEVEAFYQFGSISSSSSPTAARQDISATFIHADIGYSFPHPIRPRVSLRFDRVSGDGPGPTYSRFDTLYGMRRAELAPSGLYNSVGRANLLSPAIRFEVAPGRRTDAFFHYRPLWLASDTDSFSTSNVRDPAGRSGDFAGHQFEMRLRYWLVMNALRFEFSGLYLAKGRFLREAPNAPRSGNTTYASFNLTAFF